jgi:hypothetical protein
MYIVYDLINILKAIASVSLCKQFIKLLEWKLKFGQ